MSDPERLPYDDLVKVRRPFTAYRGLPLIPDDYIDWIEADLTAPLDLRLPPMGLTLPDPDPQEEP